MVQHKPVNQCNSIIFSNIFLSHARQNFDACLFYVREDKFYVYGHRLMTTYVRKLLQSDLCICAVLESSDCNSCCA